MLKTYHRLVTMQALGEYFSSLALEVVINANLEQDHLLRGQINHPEYHFDQNAFRQGEEYIESNRLIARNSMKAGDAFQAQVALGRLTHAAQDFYSHSNYVNRWLSRFPREQWPSQSEIDPLDDSLLSGQELRSGKVNWLFELFSWIPGVGRLLVPLLPRDSHARMNLDSPARGPAFPYVIAAACKRTRYEYDRTIQGLPSDQVAILCMKQNLQTREV